MSLFVVCSGLTLFVKKIPLTLQNAENALKAHFSKAGEVKELRIPRERTGQLKGFAYVEFKDQVHLHTRL